MGMVITATELRKELGTYLDLAAAGEEILVTKSGWPAARLVPVGPVEDLTAFFPALLDADFGEQDSVEDAMMPGARNPMASMEKMMIDIGKLLEEKEFATIDEANAYLQDLLASGDGIPSVAPSTPLEEAQDLIYQAREEPRRATRIKLAKKALKISPDCADAYVLLAEEEAQTLQQAVAYFEQGVAAGERALAEEFDEYVGHFWGITETRPYMRARHGLAFCLWNLGEKTACIEHLQEMLRLNPNDNQGVRYTLLMCLLDTGDAAGTDALFRAYEDDASAEWQYGLVLHLFRMHGPGKQSAKALKEAIKWNSYVPAYLLGTKRLPKKLPEYIDMGGKSEAVGYVAQHRDRWQATPGALDWLKTQMK